jgi:cyclopropane-fatty-acyl-phospholipid synthase
MASLYARLFNRQSIRKSRRVAEVHYNLGNDFYRAMLGNRMAYTCAYWENARTLNEAEEDKLELVCQKLELKRGMTVLELGCGWGSFAKYAAERYDVSVLGVNIAEEQVKLGRELCKGLPVDLRVQDYREVKGLFDRVVSIGIMEHIGPKNYRTYMRHAADHLKDDGIAFIHTISQNTTNYHCDPWFDRYIFPNAVTPSLQLLTAAMEGLFVVEDYQNIGPHYDPTLMAWYENMTRAWPSLKDKYGERFYRIMKYYLLSSAGCFRARRSQVAQIVMTKPGRLQPKCRAGGFPLKSQLLAEESVIERR